MLKLDALDWSLRIVSMIHLLLLVPIYRLPDLPLRVNDDFVDLSLLENGREVRLLHTRCCQVGYSATRLNQAFYISVQVSFEISDGCKASLVVRGEVEDVYLGQLLEVEEVHGVLHLLLGCPALFIGMRKESGRRITDL